MLRDELYPTKVDSVNKAVVSDEKDETRAGATAVFSEENEVTVAKIAWLSRTESAKAYAEAPSIVGFGGYVLTLWGRCVGRLRA